jgi:hypothetical protein
MTYGGKELDHNILKPAIILKFLRQILITRLIMSNKNLCIK